MAFARRPSQFRTIDSIAIDRVLRVAINAVIRRASIHPSIIPSIHPSIHRLRSTISTTNEF